MTTWTVFKKDLVAVENSNEQGWFEVGTFDSDSSYSLGYKAAEEIGEQQGAGEFLLLAEDRYKRITIGERTEFYEVEAEDTAEAIMAREG